MDALDRALHRLPHRVALFVILGTSALLVTVVLSLGAYAIVTR